MGLDALIDVELLAHLVVLVAECRRFLHRSAQLQLETRCTFFFGRWAVLLDIEVRLQSLDVLARRVRFGRGGVQEEPKRVVLFADGLDLVQEAADLDAVH